MIQQQQGRKNAALPENLYVFTSFLLVPILQTSLNLTQEEVTTMQKCLSPLFVLFVSLLLVCGELKQVTNFTNSSESRDDHWDYMVFTQSWPETFRLSLESEVHIPKNVTEWTIHGVWPSQIKKEEPNSCNSSWHFNDSLIRDLHPQLSVHWPNMKEHFNLLAHEWEKHGTCAASLPTLHGEHNYFSQGLRLHAKYNITDMLAKSHILPVAEKEYAFKDVLEAIGRNVNNVSFMMQCYWDKKARVQYVSQVMLCLDKQFGLLNCDKYSGPEPEPCYANQTIQYPPIHHNSNVFNL